MSEFFIPQHYQKKTRRIIFGYLMILVGALSIVFKWIDEYSFRKLLGSVLALSFIWMGIDYLRSQKKIFIRISDEKIEWLLDQNLSKTIFVNWLDIRWIKKEEDGGITLYQESCFNNYISMNGFTKENSKEILNELSKMAISHQIRLINFSDVAVEVPLNQPLFLPLS